MFESFENLIVNAAKAAGCNTVVQDKNAPTIWLDFHAVWTSKLPAECNRQEILDEVDKILNNVLEMRKSLKAVPASDLYVMLAAPYGSADSSDWNTLAAEIERDDRLARKHVWLPDEEGENFDAFIGTTFLARPWTVADDDETRADALQLLTKQVSMPTGWQEVLLDDDLQGEDLVLKLLSIEMDEPS
ncbi:ABC-three component system middle component 1 [Janthinobacterium sp. BJB304]|uniref:ABC-three component system middle component 1 n=1 Tax=Janthinobacterium sp. BJB304 TaxID=1572871 RepID=UPI000C124082|nr:ABC-three component system middle component 1 [Janthinobacterium sp. BJB304]